MSQSSTTMIEAPEVVRSWGPYLTSSHSYCMRLVAIIGNLLVQDAGKVSFGWSESGPHPQSNGRATSILAQEYFLRLFGRRSEHAKPLRRGLAQPRR
jgi:hypothetical protein